MTEPEKQILTATTDTIPASLGGDRGITKIKAVCAYGTDAFEALRDLEQAAREEGFDAVVGVRFLCIGDERTGRWPWTAYGTAISW